MATKTFNNIQIYKSGSTRYSYTMFPSGYTISNGDTIPTAPISGVGLIQDAEGNKYFTNNGGSSSCNLTTFPYNNVNYLAENGFIELGDVVLNSSTSYYLFFPVSYFNGSNPNSYGYKASVDTRHPIIRSNLDDVSSFCDSVVSTSTNETYSLIYSTFDFDYSDSGSGGGGSTDITPLIPAILMIPATLIVLGMFSIIYRMFINRRVRG